uniref:AlNc14C193G8517 protein n=1 Tax=Albugo laibachii Nc14 TaxID=890382 RepID=F0WQ37_9STRA|nr:AlNc14C193G8517 [Albugo laibachii Nc14]|eukprot:CCA23442.1 AlNc14C193G8517 [Albugo laibachii Nc14]
MTANRTCETRLLSYIHTVLAEMNINSANRTMEGFNEICITMDVQSVNFHSGLSPANPRASEIR